jgi:N-acetylglucosaminyldiphosphoundecaprenol N-acetyl-beta-D-mannosaminyltransferase
MLKKQLVLGVGITNESCDTILKYLLSSLKSSHKKFYIVTPNPEILVYATDHPRYKSILNEAKIALPDGVGVFLTGAILGSPFPERITGVDFLEKVCKASMEEPISVGFLGGKDGIAEMTAECLKVRYPGLNVVFAGKEWDIRANDKWQMTNGKWQMLGGKREIDVLFVAFGHPKQEEWIYEHLDHLPVRVAMGVGGAFDYISGRVSRAPFMVRAVGMEWLYRLILEPWRWRRQLSLPKFVWLVLKRDILTLFIPQKEKPKNNVENR